MKLLFLGDTHGNIGWLSSVIQVAKKRHVDWIIQVGDFGYWEHKQRGVEFLFSTQAFLEDNDMQMVWLDGNHENHPVLRRNYGPVAERHFTHPEYGFWRMRPNLWHAPRGHRWTFDEVTFLAVGGAYSVDKPYRKVGSSWWWEETLDEDEVELAQAGGLVDVMVTHDCPDGVQGAIPEAGGLDRQKDRWPESLENRKKLLRITQVARPFLLVHGHYHHRNTELFRFPFPDATGEMAWHTTLIEGLNRDDDNGAFLVLETKEMKRRG